MASISSGNGQNVLKWRVLANFVLTLDEQLPYNTTAVLRGFTLKEQGEGWLFVLRATHKGKPVVAFFGGNSLEQTFERVKRAVEDYGVDWKNDRYA